MDYSLVKRIWIWFSEKLGTTFIHPQFTIIKFQQEAINEAKNMLKEN